MSDLTLNEQKHVRTTVRLLRLRLGGWGPLSKVVRFSPETLEKVTNGRRPVTAATAFRIARFIDIPVEDLLAGKYVPSGTCPHCGRAPDFADEETIAE